MIVSHRFVRLLGVCVTVAGCTAMPTPAFASFGMHSLEVSFEQAPLAGAAPETPGPPDRQAGSHPYQLTASLAFNSKIDAEGRPFPEGSAKDIKFEFPRGLIGSPNAAPKCPMSILSTGGLETNPFPCPADTQIGVIDVNSTALNVFLPLYNLVPAPGVVAQFGTVALAPVVVNFAMRTRDDGLTMEIHHLSQTLPVLGVSLKLWGIPAESSHDSARRGCASENNCPSDAPLAPLLTMPTSCSEPTITTVAADSWEDPGTRVEESVTGDGADGAPDGLSGCDRLEFDPAIAVRPESSAADTPTGLSVDVKIPYRNDPGGLAEASMRNLSVVLPNGMSINPAAAGGLVGCTDAQIAIGQASKPSCPDASRVGSLEILTPILSNALHGAIYLAQPASGLFEGTTTVYLAAEEDGVDLKLPAQLIAQPASGQLTLTMEGVPELPLSELRLELAGGPRATLANSPTCEASTATTELTPYSAPQSGASKVESNSFAIDQGCGGGFAPLLKGGGTVAGAGQEAGFALHLARTDGQPYLHRLTATLPPGLLANIGSAVQCGETEAAAGTCPASSEVGDVSVGAGAGPDPYYLNGRAYLTGPHAGAPFGLSMVIPASAGPFQLGTIVIQAGIAIDLSAGRVKIATDPLPTIVRSIPLRIKSLELTINRHGFMVNPTNCAEQAVNSTVASTSGADAALSAPFQVTGCSGLAFAPKMAASTLASASSRGRGAALDVKVTNAAGPHMNSRVMVVELPRVLRPRLSAIQQACLTAVFAVNPGGCPAGSVVGRAAIDTPTLSTPLSGPLYLVFHRGLKYPDLVMALQGSGMELQLVGAANISRGTTSVTFSRLPDMPMSLLDLDLPEGSHSLLGATARLCVKRRSNVLYTMVGQNGAQIKGGARVTVKGCRARAARADRRRRKSASPTRPSARARGRRR